MDEFEVLQRRVSFQVLRSDLAPHFAAIAGEPPREIPGHLVVRLHRIDQRKEHAIDTPANGRAELVEYGSLVDIRQRPAQYAQRVLQPDTELLTIPHVVAALDTLHGTKGLKIVEELRDLGEQSPGGIAHRLNHAGLALGVAWLALTLVIKAHVERVAGDSLTAGVTRHLTTPSPFNAVLRRAVAMPADGRSLEGCYSLLDPEPPVSFVSRTDRHERLEPLRSEAAVARLTRSSRGFFSARELGSGEIELSILRMGFEERLVFSFVVGRREGEAIEPAPIRRRPHADFAPATWARRDSRADPNLLCYPSTKLAL